METLQVIPTLVFGGPLVGFWGWMFVAAIKNDFEHRSFWITMVVLFNVFGSVVFYFAVYTKEIKASKELDLRFNIQEVRRGKLKGPKE